MKKIFTILCLMITMHSFAQPSLLSTEMAAPGTVFTYKHVGTFSAIDTSAQGANQTWDFSAVTTTTDPDYVNEIINPALTPHADSFPTANWGILEDGTDYYFFNLNSSTMERVGSWDASGYTYYTNTQVEYIFPMVLGTSGSDVSVNEQNGSSTTGNYTFDCIGYGTLMAPGHTYTNVIMTRVLLDIGFLTLESYIWYDSDNGMPVFDYIPGDGGFIPEAAIYLDNVSIGIKENIFANNVRYNNPVTSMLNIKFDGGVSSSLNFNLMNTQGKKIVSGEIIKGSAGQLNLDMKDQAAGIYLLWLNDKNDATKSRLIKIVKE